MPRKRSAESTVSDSECHDVMGQDLNPVRQTVILEQISEEPIHDRMKYLFESFKLYSLLDAD